MISNAAGRLFCEPPAQKNSIDIPEGTYQQSCNGCSQKDDVLSCSQCRSPDGALVASEIQVTGCIKIENNNGLLFCEREGGGEQPQAPEKEIVASDNHEDL
eukprot:c17664_g1_i1.p1 GENE.c17664_g1_i1~~c17664_g1_i1.p1  ORF type:complete len:101 (+),score=44.24 c17664_g1_i1:256-558(+)